MNCDSCGSVCHPLKDVLSFRSGGVVSILMTVATTLPELPALSTKV